MSTLAAIVARHVADEGPGKGAHRGPLPDESLTYPCVECGMDWPCDVVLVGRIAPTLVSPAGVLAPGEDMFSADEFDDPESPFYDDSPWVPVPAALGGVAPARVLDEAALREALEAIWPLQDRGGYFDMTEATRVVAAEYAAALGRSGSGGGRG